MKGNIAIVHGVQKWGHETQEHISLRVTFGPRFGIPKLQALNAGTSQGRARWFIGANTRILESSVIPMWTTWIKRHTSMIHSHASRVSQKLNHPKTPLLLSVYLYFSLLSPNTTNLLQNLTSHKYDSHNARKCNHSSHHRRPHWDGLDFVGFKLLMVAFP